MIVMIKAFVISVKNKIIFKVIFTVACLQATVSSYSQTEEQKQMMYDYINSFSSPTLVSIFPKPAPIPNKDALFKYAQVFPVYKIVFDTINEPKLIQNENYYLVFYNNELYEFMNDDKSSYFKESPIIDEIKRINSNIESFKIVYITNSFNVYGKILNPLFIDIRNNSITAINNFTGEKNTYQLENYINYKYGSFEKMKELQELDNLREKLTITDYYDFLKTDYPYFNYNCPKDTMLVLKTLVNQVRVATKNFTKGQESKLLERIINKITPFNWLTKKLISNYSLNEPERKKYLNDLKIKEQEYKNGMLNVRGFYEYKVYDVSITNDLLETLTSEQFNDYKKYIDIRKPVVETLISNYNNKYRHLYIGNKNKEEEKMELKTVNQVLEECGCPYDETIEGRTKSIKLEWKKPTN